jgi:tetratricopeptide (TPR) repeat protein
MSSPAIACPHCRASLRSSRELPENKKVRCPQCGASFRTPSMLAPLPLALSMEPLEPVSSQSSRLGIAALFVGMFILGGMAVAGIYLAQPNPPASPVAESPKPVPPKDDKPTVEEDRRVEERRQRQEEEKRLAFERRMRKAEEALTEKRFADAENSYKEALKLYPDDAAAKKGLSAAKASRQAADDALAHDKEEKELRQKEIAQLHEQGDKAMRDKEYAAAVQAYAQAKKLAPDDEQLGKALEAAKTAADEDAAEKKKLADYRKHLEDGRAAMNAERFEDAVAEFQAALNLLPGDAAAALDLKTAQKRLDADSETAKKQDKYAQLMREVQAELDAKHPDRAVPILKQIVKQFPDDKEARRLLRKSMRDAATAASEYNRLMTLGDAAMSRGRFDEAKRLYVQAADAIPDDARARAKAQMADKAFANAAANQPRYNALMLQAAAATRQLQYAQAIAAYNQALQLMPNDVRAAQLLLQARYGQALTAGRIALAQNRVAEAIALLEQALVHMPNDAAAAALLAEARLRAR